MEGTKELIFFVYGQIWWFDSWWTSNRSSNAPYTRISISGHVIELSFCDNYQGNKNHFYLYWHQAQRKTNLTYFHVVINSWKDFLLLRYSHFKKNEFFFLIYFCSSFTSSYQHSFLFRSICFFLSFNMFFAKKEKNTIFLIYSQHRTQLYEFFSFE